MPASSIIKSQKSVPRLPMMPRKFEIKQKAQIPLKVYPENPSQGLRKIKVMITKDQLTIDKPSSFITCLYHLWMLTRTKLPLQSTTTTGWNHFMELLTNAREYHICKIIYRPFINAAPSNYNMLYTMVKQALKATVAAGKKTYTLTFDLPLYVKTHDY